MRRIMPIFLLLLFLGCNTQPPEPDVSTINLPNVELDTLSPKNAVSNYYNLEEKTITAQVPAYTLPLKISDINNYEDVKTMLGIGNQEEKIIQNGFVVKKWYGDDIIEPYKNLKQRGVPIFVTSDTLLHLYHIQFNEILKKVEQEEFYPKLIQLSKKMVEESEQQYSQSKGQVREAARRNVAFFSVALKILDPDYPVPSYVSNEVNSEIGKIEEHKGFSPSIIFNTNSNCNCLSDGCYCEDYSQYVPRGHYTQTEELKKYFKAMMWFGRMTFLAREGVATQQDSEIATKGAVMIVSSMESAQVKEIWDRIYSVTSFMVGVSDDLTPYEYQQAINKAFGESISQNDLDDEQKLLNLKGEIASMRLPEIYGGTGICVIYPPWDPIEVDKCLSKTQGMRFMGQRYVPDSYMFQSLVFPRVEDFTGSGQGFTMCMTQAGPSRCFPRGLDVMAVMGSDRALEILNQDGDTDYVNYTTRMNQLRGEFSSLSKQEWNRNLYFSWMYSLQPLLEEFGTGYPTFMQTNAWKDKSLSTALCSWAELRHDTILYAKQSYTPFKATSMPPQDQPVVGYVEPVPEFYSRLKALTQMTRNGLDDMEVLDEQSRSRLEELENLLDRLTTISEKELNNQQLSEDDYEFIRNFGEQLEGIVMGVNNRGKETTIIADVHTDTNTQQVLEEGVGNVDMLIVAYRVPDGRILLGAGPVMSYYEFKHPMDDRLTDEAWKQMIESQDRPGFVESLLIT